MAYSDMLLQDIKELEARKEVRNLDKISKKVVDYLLSEIRETVTANRMPIKKKVSKQYSVHLFNLRFMAYGGLYISTFHKFGAAHISCIKECKHENVEVVIKAIATVCEFLHWDIEVTSLNVKSSDREMDIFAKIPEGATPWGVAFLYKKNRLISVCFGLYFTSNFRLSFSI